MNTKSEPFLQVRSEVGPLKRILLHRPSRELEQLIPQYLDEMLFEDIPYLAQMQHEHDKFAEALRARGAEVLYFENGKRTWRHGMPPNSSGQRQEQEHSRVFGFTLTSNTCSPLIESTSAWIQPGALSSLGL